MKPRKFFANLVISLASIAVLFILLEFFLILFPKYSFYYIYPQEMFENAEAPLDFKLVPNFKGRMIGEYNVEVKINSEGLRDYEHESVSKKFKLLALGDSMTFGQGIEIDKTFLSVIEKKLGIEVIKAGVPAYGQDNELEYFKTKGAKYRPDAVVIFYYPNDNDDNAGNTDRKIAYGSLIQKYRYESLPKWKLYIYTKLYRTNTLRLIRGDYTNLMAAFGRKESGLIENRLFLKNQSKENADWAKTYALLREFKKSAGNSKLVVVYTPSKHQIYSSKYPKLFDSSTDIDKPNKVLGEIAASLNIAYIDVTGEFRNLNDQELYFSHDLHLSEKGHEVFGDMVAGEITKHLK